ncbi:alcohol oxidase [Violaceomyces palustris]|uniref:Alcohol oxidase n=1 Tax=Violaceomyces palustris TaxID=1673888 RepID=A0ACD0NXH5_9BASI|nr:alcohol oxidase [Violaceomyces palustris]
MGLFTASPLLSNPASFATASEVAPISAQQAFSGTKTYDYIVIGGGTAGCVLASRLSENPKVSVLVVEAGGTNNVLEAQAPLTFGKLFKTDKDWNYETTPQRNVDSRKQFWPRGKLLGGCSSINAMMYHHCSPSDYDEWAKVYGCEGWSYKEMQKYFKKAEQFTPRKGRVPVDLKNRGSNGMWKTGHSYISEIGGKGFVGGCQEVGIPFTPDVNTPAGTEGVTHFMTFIDPNGRRSSAATAYLTPEVQKRPNLKIGVEVMVTRVIFDRTGSKPRAIAIELEKEKGGQRFYASAKTQIIVSGGSVNTPQTLMLSGIGPKATLSKYGIETIVDSPNVGENLKDHFCTTTILCKAKPSHTLDYLTSDLKAMPALARWMVTGGGPLTNNIGECAAFFRSTDTRLPVVHKLTKEENKPKHYGSDERAPDIELIGTPIAYIDHGATTAKPGEGIFSIVPIGLRPKSTGQVTISSADPWDKAVIDPRYWTDPEDNDRKVLIAGLRVCIKVAQSEALKPYLEDVPKSNDINNEWWPWCADADKITDDQLIAWMPKKSFTLYHPVATARMGTSIENGVVDLDLNVYGVDGLTVCDASIFPEQISGHPTACVIAVAEKCSEILANKASSSSSSSSDANVSNQAHL